MRLHDTVVRFASEIFTDVFDPLVEFKAKLNPFAEVANSGPSSQRRILETEPLTIIPAERVVVSPSGQVFIVADRNIDFWNGSPIRHKYPILPIDGVGELGMIGELLAGTPSETTVYAYPYFVRRESDEMEMSDYYGGFELYFSKLHSFFRGSILHLLEEYYRLKTDTWVEGAGFGMGQAVKLEDPMQTMDFTPVTGEYDPVNDSYPTTPVPAVSVFVEPLRQDYDFVTPAFEKIAVGDKAISVLKAVGTVKVNDHFDDYRVLSLREFTTYYTCQCRKENV